MINDDEADRNEWIRLPWDSQHFGFPIARLLPRSLREERLSRVLRSIESAGIRCLYWLTEESDSQMELAQREAFQKVDVRMELEVQLGQETLETDGGLIRLPDESDLAPLKILAAKSHRNTRFYTGAFPKNRADALYSAWIERSFRDASQEVLVSGPVGAPDGYIAFGISESGNGLIGLVAVEEARRGRGVGSALVSAALNRFRRLGIKRVIVITQGSNQAARRLYGEFGFSERRRSAWFHRWFDVLAPWI